LVQSAYFGHNRGSFAGDKTGGGGGGGWDGELDRLVWAKEMDGRDASSCGTDIECFRKLYEFRTGGVRAPEKYGNLDAEAR